VRFGLVHRIMTDALAALGVLAVVSTASLNPWTNLVLVIGLAVALAIPEGWQGRPLLRHFATIAPLLLLLVQGARLLAGRSPLDVAVEFATLLQIVRLATRRGAAHDQQIIVLALLHFIAGTVLGGGLTYGLCFLGFLVVAPGALVLSHLRREVEGNYRQGARDRTGLPVDVPRILRSRRVVGRGFLATTCLLSVPILLFTTALFLLFPRVGLSLLLLNHPRSGRMIGFSDRVDLGDVGALREDPTLALHFTVSDLHDPPPTRRIALSLRGTAFDLYDGHAWARSPRETRTPDHMSGMDGTELYVLGRRPAQGDRIVSIDLEPIDPPVVFIPQRLVALRLKPQRQILLGEPLAIQRGGEDELRYSGSDSRGLHYDAYVANSQPVLPEALSAADRSRYLALPWNMPPRIVDLARVWTADRSTPAAKAAAIQEHLRKDFAYDVASPSQGKPQPLDHFLFESKRGHCEFFSTAMAVMLRAVGVPSRNVTGFVGGTWNSFGHYYSVRQGDAHSWIEAYIDDGAHSGWSTFDPTPSGASQLAEPHPRFYYDLRDALEALSQDWNRYVVGYDLHKQGKIFDEVTRSYERLRARTGVKIGSFASDTRAGVASVLALLLAVAGYVVWKRRRQLQTARAKGGQGHPNDAHLESAVALYRTLELALQHHGITRAPSVPPLRHAELLRDRSHPLADEILALTSAYLEARFGGQLLTDGDKRDYERRVREIRSFRPDRPVTTSPA
jgi:protein-glutamine gamma-glutamyltransferase